VTVQLVSNVSNNVRTLCFQSEIIPVRRLHVNKCPFHLGYAFKVVLGFVVFYDFLATTNLNRARKPPFSKSRFWQYTMCTSPSKSLSARFVHDPWLTERDGDRLTEWTARVRTNFAAENCSIS
jgi:hypothetical protein